MVACGKFDFDAETAFRAALNGGAPVDDPAKQPRDWHEIKAWAEEFLRVRRE